MAYRDQPLGELALSIPRASAMFRKYDMDYCCGGKQTLARAAARKELDVEVIEAELAKLAEQPIEKDWRSAPLAEIIDHIIVRYHDRHREQRVHADKPSVPKGLTKYLTMLHEELSSHMMKEEQILFPMIKQGMGSQAMGPISVMESEHDEAGELLEVIKHTTNNVTPPPEACTTWKYLTMLHEELSSHMMKEEQILFPMIKQGMGSQAMGPISVMESEHDEAGELLEVIKHTTNNVTPPPEACTTWKAMYNGINELIDDLMDHISVEIYVLFPRALAGE